MHQMMNTKKPLKGHLAKIYVMYWSTNWRHFVYASQDRNYIAGSDDIVCRLDNFCLIRTNSAMAHIRLSILVAVLWLVHLTIAQNIINNCARILHSTM